MESLEVKGPWKVNPRPYFAVPGGRMNKYSRELPWLEGSSREYSYEAVSSNSDGIEILDLIGLGTYSAVYRAYWKPYKQEIAVKVYEKSKGAGKRSATLSALKRVEAEVESLKYLKHPNIIGFYGAIENKMRINLLFEIVETGNLLQYIMQNGPLGTNLLAKKWFAQLASAMTYIHKNFIGHRDLKCENILLDIEQNIRISDFGFAKGGMTWREDTPNTSFTKTNEYCGSLAYMSPEIVGKRPYSPILSDVWAMGVVLHAILFGTFPYHSVDFKEIAKLPQKFSVSRSSIPPDIFNLMKHIFQFEDKRIRSYQLLDHEWVKSQEEEVFTGKLGHKSIKEAKEYLSVRNGKIPEIITQKIGDT